MRESDILRIVVKAFGLYLIVLMVLDVRDLLLYIMSERLQSNTDDHLFYKYMYIGHGARVIYLGLAAFFLLYKAGLIANAITGKDREAIVFEFTRTTSIELVVIAISAIIVFHSIPEILTRLTEYAYFLPHDQTIRDDFWLRGNNRNGLIFSAFKLATGIMALINARAIARKLTGIGDRYDEATRTDHE